MSDKKEIKNLDNLTKINFQKIEKDEFKDEFINKAEVHSILSSNFGRISHQWYKFVTAWNHNAYKTFMDMDKYLILIYLVQKFEHLEFVPSFEAFSHLYHMLQYSLLHWYL